MLVPLCVRQSATAQALALYGRHDVVVWWSTAVEVRSALARLARMKQLSPEAWTEARQRANSLADSWLVVEPSDALRAQAEQLVDDYDLRVADALQLAAALAWCEGAPQGRIFLTADQRLRAAALLSGFEPRTPL